MGRGKAPAQRVATSDEGGWSFRAMGPRYVFGPDRGLPAEARPEVGARVP